MILFDNIIFSLQRAGGISVVWKELLDHVMHSGQQFKCIEYQGADSNLFRQHLDLPAHNVEQRKALSLNLAQLINPQSFTPPHNSGSYSTHHTSALALTREP